MIYAMADLHGCFDLYTKMLKEIDLKPEDTLYILGDVVDRGPDGIKILLDLMQKKNVKMLLGNHDLTAKQLLSKLMTAMTEEAKKEYMQDLDLWEEDGGKPTYLQYERATPEEHQRILDYLDNRGVRSRVEVNGKKYVLSHTLPSHRPEKELFDASPILFVAGETEYDKRYSDEMTFVTGHVPTGLIDPNYAGKIWHGNGHIAIDCGAVFTGTLGCIRLDDEKEFYVSKNAN